MNVGTIIARLHIPECANRKTRRSIVKSNTNRLRNKFTISIAELSHENSIDMVTFGIASISISKKHVLVKFKRG